MCEVVQVFSYRNEGYEPKGVTQSIECCLFAMFHASVDDEDKYKVMRSFQHENGICCVISTIAFGMGVDIPDIRVVVHYGPPADVEDYIQESGRSGRDNKLSKAVLYLYPVSLIGLINKSMKMYCKLDKEQCRRQELLKYFPSSEQYTPHDPIHTCCDLCMSRCGSGVCDDFSKFGVNSNVAGRI